MEDLYAKLAYDYDEFGSIEKYLGDEKKFFENLFNMHSTKTVLDCACGTGQHLLMVHNLNIQVCGSDYSDSMLEVAEKNLSKNNIKISLTQCDFRYLENSFIEKFDAVLCLTNSLPHLETNEDLVKALKSMRNRLNNEGILVLTSGTTYNTLTKTPPIETVINSEDFSRVFVKEVKDGFLTINILDLYHSKKRTESNQYNIRYKILSDIDYKNLLTQAGFSKINIYGDYSMNVFDREKSRRIIVVAQK